MIPFAIGGKLGLAMQWGNRARGLARGITSTLASGLATTMAAEAPAQPPLVLAVHPYLGATEIQRRFAPLADYLGMQLGYPVQVRVGSDFQQHIDAVGLNLVDIALGVLNGDFDTGAIRGEVYDAFADRGLRVLMKLPEVSEHVFVTRSNLPANEVLLLRQALLQLPSAPHGTAILRAINQGMTGMVPVTDADFDSMRKFRRVLEGNRQ